MTYQLSTPLTAVKGIGSYYAKAFTQCELFSVKDLLLFLPYRYEDRSHLLTIAELKKKVEQQQQLELITIQATVKNFRTHFRGRKSMQKATLIDETQQILYCQWFNASYLQNTIEQGKTYFFSGKVRLWKGMLFLSQPTVEVIKQNGQTHTNRIVPIYSSIASLQQGKVRSIIQHILEHLALESDADALEKIPQLKKYFPAPPLTQAFQALHFPEQEDAIIQARQRLAVEELIGLIQHSRQIKNEWSKQKHFFPLSITPQQQTTLDQAIAHLPFSLTNAQQRCWQETKTDLTSPHAMNRLLIGDVGSGKTVVAGLAAVFTTLNGGHACVIAPTQMLAKQHADTLQHLFPKQEVHLVSTSAAFLKKELTQPGIIVGTHAVLNWLKKYQGKIPVGLVVFDEQHRFGVVHRSLITQLKPIPHLLSMTATPIPRTLMLTIFAHLSFSLLDELPKNRLPTKTHALTTARKSDLLNWILQQTKEHQQRKEPFLSLFVCPHINPSAQTAKENIAAVTQTFEELESFFGNQLRLGLLHGKLKAKEKESIIHQLYQQEIDLLVATPVIEVGVDLPQASVIVIDSAEQFGLASLHQLRGRVGRAGQQGSCFVIVKKPHSERFQLFCKTTDGQKLSEFDLQQRGAGNLFGREQHGFDDLRFSDWSDWESIKIAKSVVDYCEQNHVEYQSFILPIVNDDSFVPGAN